MITRFPACVGRLALALSVIAALVSSIGGYADPDDTALDNGQSRGERVSATRASVMQPDDERKVATSFRNAVIMLHAKEYDYALVSLHRVLALAPRMPEAHVNMGYALLGLERPSAARDFFLTAIELRPQQANAYWGLAASLESLCDIAGSIGAMRSFIHLADAGNPFLPRARAALWEWESAPVADGGCIPAGAGR